jgi:PAS domain-containing protein
VTALDGNLDQYLTIGFGLTALLYLALAARVSRAAVGPSNRAISSFLFLIGLMVAGSAFSYNTANANLYGIGRTLAVFSGSFLPLMFYIIYREFTIGRPSVAVWVTLSVVPVMSVLLAMTNPLHHMIWTIVEANGVVRFTNANEHLWFNRVQAPFSYGLLAYSVIALSSWLPTIARAHRKKVVLLLVCAVLPFAVSIGNTPLDIGPPAFPFTSLTLALMLPLYGWASLGLRVYEFSPLVYQTMFNHVRDPIFVLDRSQRIISANEPAQELFKSPERDLIGRLLWEDLPGAQAIIERAKDGDMKQTIRMESDRFFELNAAPLNGPSGQDQASWLSVEMLPFASRPCARWRTASNSYARWSSIRQTGFCDSHRLTVTMPAITAAPSPINQQSSSCNAVPEAWLDQRLMNWYFCSRKNCCSGSIQIVRP